MATIKNKFSSTMEYRSPYMVRKPHDHIDYISSFFVDEKKMDKKVRPFDTQNSDGMSQEDQNQLSRYQNL